MIVKKLFNILILFPVFIFYICFVILSLCFDIKIIPLDFSKIGRIQKLFWIYKINKFNEIKKRISFKIYFMEYKFICNYTWFKLFTKNIKISKFSFFYKKILLIDTFFNFNLLSYDFDFFQNPILSFYNQNKFKKLKKKIINNAKKDRLCLLSFSQKDILSGKKYLKSIGTSENSYIVFNSRDNNYLKKVYPENNWNYHNYRNSKIKNYIKAADSITKFKLIAIRTGSFVKEKIQTKNKRIIDYSNSNMQSDLLDIYLGSKCLFAVYSQSGISWISEVSGKPIVYVNWPGVAFSCFNHNSLVIPKKFFDKKKRRYLTFSEIFKHELQSNFRSDYYYKNDIKIIDNTEDEINQVVMEQYLRISKKWKNDIKDENLQNKFWRLFNFNIFRSPTFRVGSNYLRENADLLN